MKEVENSLEDAETLRTPLEQLKTADGLGRGTRNSQMFQPMS